MYHVCVVTLMMVATDVDLLQSSSQSLFCGGFANCVGSVGDVARLGICQESISSNRRCRANTALYHNTFARVLCLSQSLCYQNLLTDHAQATDFSALFHTLKLQVGLGG